MTDELPDLADLLALFDGERMSEATGDGAPREKDGPVIRIDYPHSGFVATPSDTGLRGAALDELIARQRDHFAALGREVEWKTYDYDQPVDLTARLEAAGFAPQERETVVVGSVEELALHPGDVDGVAFRETTAAADLVAIGELHTEVWQDDWTWIAEDLAGRIERLGQDGFRVLVAEADGRIVSAAWLVMRAGSQFASLWGGSTLEAFRGRGIYRALISRRAALARSGGYRFLQVDASDMSRPILERLGFVAIASTTPYVYPSSADAMYL